MTFSSWMFLAGWFGGSGVTVAVVFGPLRRELQERADRRAVEQ